MSKASGALALIGGAAAAVGVFLNWITDSYLELTGWDFYDLGNGILDYYFAPMVVLLLGLMVVSTAFSAILGRSGIGSRIVFLIGAIGFAVLPILVIGEFVDALSLGTMGFFDIEIEYYGMGLFMAFGGALLTLIAAVLPGEQK